MKVNINRQAAGLEDLLFGVGTVEQLRQGVMVEVTRINAANLPFDESQNLAEALTPITEQIIPNLVEILAADDNAAIATAKAGIATAKASEALTSANNALASELAAAASESQIASHLINTSNPHSVTKAQVGLSNVDNTSDSNKPVSTAQQTALNSKQPLDATLTALAGVSTSADKYIYATSSDTFTTGTITAFGRSLVDDTDAATARTTLGVSATNTPSTAVGGISATNVQAALQELDTEKVNKSVVVTTAITSVTFNADGSLTIVTP